MAVRDFLASNSSEIIVGVVAGVVGSIAYGTLGWCWSRWVQTWDKRAERRRLLEDFAIDAMNFVGNMERWIDGDKTQGFVLFPQGPAGISKAVGPMVLEHVGKLQSNLMERLIGFNGLFGFSKRQRDLMDELHRRLGRIGAGIKYFGQPVRWDQATADRNYDVEYARAAWADLLPLIQHVKNQHQNSAFLRAMRLRFRFASPVCPQFPPAHLPPLTDSKGVKIMEYFGPLNISKKPAA